MKSDLRAGIVALARAGKSDREIMAALGITKNAVIGHRHRAGVASNRDPLSPKSWSWRPNREPPQTLFDRMNAIEARFNAVLRECSGPGLRVPPPARVA